MLAYPLSAKHHTCCRHAGTVLVLRVGYAGTVLVLRVGYAGTVLVLRVGYAGTRPQEKSISQVQAAAAAACR
eukprot:297174-Rhodomonas_salina.1